MYDPYAEFKKYVLPNGLEIHHAHWDRAWVTVEVVIHSSSREDPLHLPGLAHFVEHLVSNNIPGYTHDEAENFIEGTGGDVMFGSTDYLATRYRFTIPADRDAFKKAVEIFGRMLLFARLTRFIERERKIILEEFKQRYPFKERLDWTMTMRGAVFQGHRLETWNRPIGRPEGFMSATEADLQSYYDAHYVPRNISLVILGGMEAAETMEILNASPFGVDKPGTRTPIPSSFSPQAIVGSSDLTVRMSDYSNLKLDQTEYTTLWAFSSEFPSQALRVFKEILNHILFEEVREKRELAYSTGGGYAWFQNLREFGIKARINDVATDEIGAVIRECIAKAADHPELFAQKLAALKRRTAMVDCSGLELVEHSADDLENHHEIRPITRSFHELHEVTPEHMKEAVSLLDASRQYTFIIRP